MLKMGRTHLQDAVPMSMGEEFHGFATNLDEELARIEDAYCSPSRTSSIPPSSRARAVFRGRGDPQTHPSLGELLLSFDCLSRICPGRNPISAGHGPWSRGQDPSRIRRHPC